MGENEDENDDGECIVLWGVDSTSNQMNEVLLILCSMQQFLYRRCCEFVTFLVSTFFFIKKTSYGGMHGRKYYCVFITFPNSDLLH